MLSQNMHQFNKLRIKLQSGLFLLWYF